MKKRILSAMVFFLVLLAQTGCNRNESFRPERYTQPPASAQEQSFQNEVGQWLAAEDSYIFDASTTDTPAGIVMPSARIGKLICGSRLFYQANSDYSNGGSEIWKYTDLRSGESFTLCPDPACTHDASSGCRYRDLEQLCFHPTEENLLYAVKTAEDGCVLYEIHLDADRFQEIYRTADAYGQQQNEYHVLNLDRIDNGMLFFYDECIRESVSDDSESTTVQETVACRYSIREKTLERGAADLTRQPIYTSAQTAFIADQQNKKLWAESLSSGERTLLLDYAGQNVGDFFYDTAEDALYFRTYRYEETPDGSVPPAENVSGCVYRVDSALRCEKLPLPSEQLLSFQLTGRFLYYTAYDPIAYGTGIRDGSAVYDRTGGKIYRVPRGQTMSPEVVFESHDQLFPEDYLVFGDYIYLDYLSLVGKDTASAYFMRMHTAYRVGISQKTIRWLHF